MKQSQTLRPFPIFAATFAVFIAAASLPSPIYAIFQHQWRFSAITLTIVFAVYALSLLVALLFCGSLSDYIGRRPVLIAALAIEAISMSTFALARGVGWLITARLLQGFATGNATAALSAGLIDSQPKSRPNLAALIATIVPVASLGVGALLSGVLAQYAPWPTHLSFWVICAGAILLAIATATIPETAERRSGWPRALRPVVSLPPQARPQFMVAAPSLIAVWALTGLFLSLGPSIAIELLRNSNHLVGGLVILTLTAAGAGSSYLLRQSRTERLLAIGTTVATIGLLATLVGLALTNTWWFFVGTFVAGLGFGPTFTGAFRHIMNQASGDDRAGLASALYLLSYLAFGVPAVVAGIAATTIGLRLTASDYTVAVIVLYLATLGLLRVRPLAQSSSV